ncbi:MAG: uroporphyrinogen-III synthase, partial [Deltaproteobacteria bacterium]|nr:uroporphyrinogen-III synthase [Deltaproteobacteria bacterium]
CDATILAAAGLVRLNILKKYGGVKISELKHFVPAIGQGIIAIEMRAENSKLNELIRKALNDAEAEACATAERAFLSAVGGDCHTPIGAHAVIENGKISLTGFAADAHGKNVIRKSLTGSGPSEVGRELGNMFVKMGARKIIGLIKIALMTQLKPVNAEFIKENGLENAEILHLPLIEIKEPSDGYRSLDAAIKEIKNFDWIVFTSGNAVEGFCRRMKLLNIKIDDTQKFKVAAVGPTTAALLKSKGMKVDLMPAKNYSSPALAEGLGKIDMKGKKVLFPRAREGLETLVEELNRLGAKVDFVEAYETVPAKIDKEKWTAIFKNARPDIICFSSPSAIRKYLENFGTEFLSDDVEIRCAGRTTLAEAKRLLPSFQALVFSQAR